MTSYLLNFWGGYLISNTSFLVAHLMHICHHTITTMRGGNNFYPGKDYFQAELGVVTVVWIVTVRCFLSRRPLISTMDITRGTPGVPKYTCCHSCKNISQNIQKFLGHFFVATFWHLLLSFFKRHLNIKRNLTICA